MHEVEDFGHVTHDTHGEKRCENLEVEVEICVNKIGKCLAKMASA